MQVEELVETALARAGSEDFGEDTWREGLDVLVDSLTRESALNELGQSVMIDQIVDSWSVVSRSSNGTPGIPRSRTKRSWPPCSGSDSRARVPLP